MISIKIPADVERRLVDLHDGTEGATREALTWAVSRVVELINEAHARADRARAKNRISYDELVVEFRRHLGERLALPPNPSGVWRKRLAARATDLGLDNVYIGQLCERVLRNGGGPWDIGWLVWNTPKLLALGTPEVKTGRD